jgi:hypothetical protein
LRETLGGGEQLPAAWNKYFPVNIGSKGRDELPLGTFTMSHAAGYGLLYQLTDDKKYAALARQCLEKMFDPELYRVLAAEIKAARGKSWEPKGPRWEKADLAKLMITYGQPDRDERYTWTRPGAPLRVGPMMAWVALAYDLCYDGWDDAFRQRVAREILDYNHTPVDYDHYAEGHKGNVTVERLVNPTYPPESNHFGAYTGGTGIALLAIRHDPGVDDARVDGYLKKIEHNAIRLMSEGFGDHGFFSEGPGPSQMSVDTGFVPFLQAARVAWGKDFVNPRTNGRWLTLRWAMEIVPDAVGKAWYPNYSPSSYGKEYIEEDSRGIWSEGFGALTNPDEKAAMLWTWNQSLGRAAPQSYDVGPYPHRAVLALVNWPFGLTPKNPGEVLGHVNVDAYMGHYMFRKQWKDADDLYFTIFLNPRAKHGYVKSARGGNFAFWGLGVRPHNFGRKLRRPQETLFQPQADGGGVLSFQTDEKKITSVLVDYSEKAGVPGLVVIANPWFSEKQLTEHDWAALRPMKTKDGARFDYRWLKTANTEMFVMTIQRGAPPAIKTEGDRLTFGAQRIRFDGQALVME